MSQDAVGPVSGLYVSVCIQKPLALLIRRFRGKGQRQASIQESDRHDFVKVLSARKLLQGQRTRYYYVSKASGRCHRPGEAAKPQHIYAPNVE